MEKIIKAAIEAGKQKFKRKSPIYEIDTEATNLRIKQTGEINDQEEINQNVNLTLKEMLNKYGVEMTAEKFKDTNAYNVDDTKIIKDINELWKTKNMMLEQLDKIEDQKEIAEQPKENNEQTTQTENKTE